jgi:hypothetical protein
MLCDSAGNWLISMHCDSEGKSHRKWGGGLISMLWDGAGNWFPCTVTMRGKTHRIWEGGLIPWTVTMQGIDSLAMWQRGEGLMENEKEIDSHAVRQCRKLPLMQCDNAGDWFPCTVTARGSLIENEEADWFPCCETVQGIDSHALWQWWKTHRIRDGGLIPCTVTMQGVDSRALCIDNKKGDWLPCTVSVREMSHIKLEGGLIPMHCDSAGEISLKMRRGIDSHAVWQCRGMIIVHCDSEGRSHRKWEGGSTPMQCDSAGEWFPCTVTMQGIDSHALWQWGEVL